MVGDIKFLRKTKPFLKMHIGRWDVTLFSEIPSKTFRNSAWRHFLSALLLLRAPVISYPHHVGNDTP